MLIDDPDSLDLEQYLYSRGRATRLLQYSLGDGDFTAYSGMNDADS